MIRQGHLARPCLTRLHRDSHPVLRAVAGAHGVYRVHEGARTHVRGKGASGTLASSLGQSGEAAVRVHARAYVTLPGRIQPARWQPPLAPASSRRSAKAARTERTGACPAQDRTRDCRPDGSGQIAQAPSTPPATSRAGPRILRRIRCRSAYAGSAPRPVARLGWAHACRRQAARKRGGAGEPFQAAARADRASSIAATAASKASSVDAWRGG